MDRSAHVKEEHGRLGAGATLLDTVEALLLERIGFDVGDRLLSRLQSSVEAVARELGRSPSMLVRDLKQADLQHPAWRMLLAHVTIGETYFFRDARQFAALRGVILPALLEERRKTRSLAIWSAGCASGEEPYSVAIVVRELLEEPERWRLTIVGTDVNEEALHRAREGLYRRWSFRRTSQDLIQMYFERENGLWRLHDDVRNMVVFQRLNLAEPALPDGADALGGFDLVLCRNVLMYMSPRVRTAVARRLASAVRPGGRLMVAAAELDRSLFPQLVQERDGEATVYRRPRIGEPAPLAERHPVVPMQRAPGPPTPAICQHAGGSITAGRGSRAAGRTTAASRTRRGPTIRTSHSALETADELALEARRAVDLDKTNEATAKAERALALDPLCGSAYHVLGLLALKRGDLDGAMEALRRALYLDPRLAPAHLALATVAARKGRTDAARRHQVLGMDLLREMPEDGEVPGQPGVTAGELLASLEHLPGGDE